MKTDITDIAKKVVLDNNLRPDTQVEKTDKTVPVPQNIVTVEKTSEPAKKDIPAIANPVKL